jgi:hypothetical protein
MLNGIYAQRRKQALNAECGYTECLYGECRYTECRYAECHYAECCSARKSCKPYTIKPFSRIHCQAVTSIPLAILSALSSQ